MIHGSNTTHMESYILLCYSWPEKNGDALTQASAEVGPI